MSRYRVTWVDRGATTPQRFDALIGRADLCGWLQQTALPAALLTIGRQAEADSIYSLPPVTVESLSKRTAPSTLTALRPLAEVLHSEWVHEHLQHLPAVDESPLEWTRREYPAVVSAGHMARTAFLPSHTGRWAYHCLMSAVHIAACPCRARHQLTGLFKDLYLAAEAELIGSLNLSGYAAKGQESSVPEIVTRSSAEECAAAYARIEDRAVILDLEKQLHGPASHASP
jgi:hypothetical protein